MDEIPEALRYQRNTDKSSVKWQKLIITTGILGIGAIAVVGGSFLFNNIFQSRVNSAKIEEREKSIPPVETTSSKPLELSEKPANNLLGHLQYEEATASELKALTADGRVKLRTAAADKFIKMQSAARAEGIILVPISGFRSINQQQDLFFKVKEKRGQQATKRAQVSAPPGYSEHHTGYAIDIGDGKAPATHVNPSFEKTAAFRWLEKNASRYSFELSFPRNNKQGIDYEPWHWRFVGDRHSLETFYR